MCFSTDMIHSGHIAIIKKAAKLGKFENGTASKVAVDLILQKLTLKGVK